MKLSKQSIRTILFLLVVCLWTWGYFELFDGKESLLYSIRQANSIIYLFLKFGYFALAILLGLYERKHLKWPVI